MHFLKKGPRNFFKTNGMFKQIGVSSGFHWPNCRGIFLTIFNVLVWGGLLGFLNITHHSTHALTMNMVKKIPPQFSQWNPLKKPICLNMPLVLKIFLAAFWKIQIFVPNIFRFKTQIQTTFVLFNIFSKKAHEIF